jgi:hypothetical protein
MDLFGDNLLGEKVCLRKALMQPNKVSLLVVSSSELTGDQAIAVQSLWTNEFRGHEYKNHEGRLRAEAIHMAIYDSGIARMVSDQIKDNLRDKIPEGLHGSTYIYMDTNQQSPVIRARRFMDVGNRFLSHAMLVDERGLVRWRSGMATVPTPEFMENLYSVTRDLMLETQYDEGD